MRRQQQSAGFAPPPQPPLGPSPGVDGGAGITQADSTDPATRATASALSRPGVSGPSITVNPGAPNVGSITAPAALGMPSAGSVLSSLQAPSTVQPGGQLPGAQGQTGLGDMFAAAMAAAQQRASGIMQAQPRTFGDYTGGGS